MKQLVEPEHVVKTIQRFYDFNEGDQDTQILLLAVGAEILDCSSGEYLDLVEQIGKKAWD